MTGEARLNLPKGFRKLSIAERREALRAALMLPGNGIDALPADRLELADIMIESAVGYLPVPFGIATGFLVDGETYDIPMAVEEPSVVAAATYAAGLVSAAGGFSTWANDPIMTAQIFLEEVPEGRETEILRRESELRTELETTLASMRARGGGYRDLSVQRMADLVRVHLNIDVRDVMGANILNTAAERARELLERLSGGRALMCILTNDAGRRRAGASFRLPVAKLARGTATGEEVARRIERASLLAQEDPSRAVTHNKGVMNGISSLALATGNDTRGVEAGVHYWACRDGRYRGVTTFASRNGVLEGSIEVPLALATVGGSVGLHPASALALRLLKGPDSPRLCRIAAALGLAQNFAALFALVTEGIQRGHMRHHSARLALAAGAKDEEIRLLAERLAAGGIYTLAAAADLLAEIRKGSP